MIPGWSAICRRKLPRQPNNLKNRKEPLSEKEAALLCDSIDLL